MVDARLLRERKRKKAKKPKFRRQESWRYKRVKKPWRRPRGIDSRMRKKKKGVPKCANVGYRGPKETRHLHPLGYKEVLVHNPRELEKIHPDKEIARIASKVGGRKRLQIIDKAEDLKIIIVNPMVPLELTELGLGTEGLEDVELEDFELDLDLEEEF